MKTDENVTELLRRATVKLAAAGIDTARLDAETLLAAILGLERLDLMLALDRRIEAEQLKELERLLDRRCAREPLSHILGRREFWSLDFRVTADVLTPRPDSETLIEAALRWIDRLGLSRREPLRILDLGTGSGCLLLALLSELPNGWGVGVDRSLAALRVARENARCLHLDGRTAFILGDWASTIAGREAAGGERAPLFDIILSNPPYIPASDIETLAPEVRQFEPLAALAGGADGLSAYRQLAPEFARLMSRRGAAFLEIGASQAGDVIQILTSTEAYKCILHKDLAGLDRCVEVEFSKKMGKDEK